MRVPEEFSATNRKIQPVIQKVKPLIIHPFNFYTILF